jgi:hypothetical protein
MTLERCSLRGFEHNRMVMLFSMMDGGSSSSHTPLGGAIMNARN